MKTEEKIILKSSPEAARFVTDISGWVDVNNRFFGKDEELARYSSHTHKDCEGGCGKIVTKHQVRCHECQRLREIERYNKLDYKEWDYASFVYSNYLDKYFRDCGDLEEYLDERIDCGEEPINSDELMLVLCKPNYFQEVDYDIWSDILPEDQDEYPKALVDAVDALNKVIESLPPASYSPSNIRTSYSYPVCVDRKF